MSAGVPSARFAEFEMLCRAMCEVAGCPMPEMAAHVQSARAISVRLDGVDVTIAHDPSTTPESAVVFTRFGQLPQGRELQACIALLQTNCMIRSTANISFACDPETGDVLLQQVRAIDTASAVDLYQSIVKFVRIALDWRATHFLPQQSSEDTVLNKSSLLA